MAQQKLKFDDNEHETMAQKLSNAFGGVTIVQKGSSDLISNGKEGKCHCLQKLSYICFAAHPVEFHSACMWWWRWIEAYGRPRWYIVRCYCYILGMGKRLRRRGMEVSTMLISFSESICHIWFIHLATGYDNRHSGALESKEISLLAAWAGCRVVRECAKRAFAKHGRAVLTSHLLEEIGPSYANLFEKGKQTWVYGQSG